MKIIAIEGLDKSGKHTQSNMLVDYLRSEGYKVEKSEFHRYDTPTGELIMKWLRKEWDVDQRTIELIMTADKQAQQEWFKQLEKDGVDFLVLDRYTGSQKVYAAANEIELSWTNELQTYMKEPYLEFFIDIDPVESMKRKGKHGENDRYESDLKLLERVRKLYTILCNRIIVVNGMQSVDKVHEDIIREVESIL